jgi:hypothetical protein
MLYHSIDAPGSGVYLQKGICHMREKLDVAAFRATWERLEAVARHPVLRTSFITEDLARPMQEVHRQVTLPFRQEDWRDIPEKEQHSLLRNFLCDDRHRGFDFRLPPLIRLTLFRLGEADYQRDCK